MFRLYTTTTTLRPLLQTSRNLEAIFPTRRYLGIEPLTTSTISASNSVSQTPATAVIQRYNSSPTASVLIRRKQTPVSKHAACCLPVPSHLKPCIRIRQCSYVGYSYWDLPYNSCNYSYIDVAVDKYGFSTLSIDRLGIGKSSTADPLHVVQVPAELSAIYELTKMLRRGSLPHVPKAFSKVVHVGHSLGSILSYNLAAM